MAGSNIGVSPLAPGCWYVKDNVGIFVENRIDAQGASMVLDNAETDTHAETGSLTLGLAGKKGLEQFVKQALGNACSQIADDRSDLGHSLLFDFLTGNDDFLLGR
jgi:hypothetical protein